MGWKPGDIALGAAVVAGAAGLYVLSSSPAPAPPQQRGNTRPPAIPPSYPGEPNPPRVDLEDVEDAFREGRKFIRTIVDLFGGGK